MLIDNTSFLLWLWNSLIITLATALVGVAWPPPRPTPSPAGGFRGRNAGLVFLLATQMIPAAMLMVPIYILALRNWPDRQLPRFDHRLLGQRGALQHLDPEGLLRHDPARPGGSGLIDGAAQFGTFWRIILPLSTPALAIVFLFNFTQAWNDYLFARIILGNAEQIWTWPLGLRTLQEQFQTQWGMFSAASILVTIPVVILFLYSSKCLISGLTLGSVKG